MTAIERRHVDATTLDHLIQTRARVSLLETELERIRELAKDDPSPLAAEIVRIAVQALGTEDH